MNAQRVRACWSCCWGMTRLGFFLCFLFVFPSSSPPSSLCWYRGASKVLPSQDVFTLPNLLHASQEITTSVSRAVLIILCNQSALSWSAQYDCQGVLQNLEYVRLHNGSIIDVFAVVGEIHARSHLFTSHLEALAAGAQVAVHRDLPT